MFVLTAQVLVNLMLHGFLSMSRINVLIFDECHHCSDNHPYAHIMNAYRQCDKGFHQ